MQSDQQLPYKTVQDIATQMGFSLVGIVPAMPSDHGDYMRRWLNAKKHGEMGYLAKHLEKRLDPGKLFTGAKSVICVADCHACNYDSTGSDPNRIGKIARYSWGDDYHKIIKSRLFQLADALRTRWPDQHYQAAVDTAPILEREHAHRAGLGWIGKHTLLIHPKLGSWMLLGQIVTTLSIDFTPPHDAEVAAEPLGEPLTDHCGSCTRCINACPTQCISPDGYQLDASRCISYLTIEHRGAIEPDLFKAMGQWVAGCDICQEVCPFNSPEHQSKYPVIPSHHRYTPRPPAPGIDLLELLDWDTKTRQEAFRSSALKRIKLTQLRRNAVIAAGNYLAQHEDDELYRRLNQIAQDPNELDLVRSTAQQVLHADNAVPGIDMDGFASHTTG
ncbi:MAG: tRNA epoxyqueuosine(34) reductase QueG [Phycisphaeraceae bacterium]|nr:tRNA epoxyqueuosine(34) reductase QueG [Phycisphaeraceae bacterium]